MWREPYLVPSLLQAVRSCWRMIPLSLHSPADAIRAGLVLAPEDRKQQGLVLGMSVQNNISLPNLRAVAHFVFCSQALNVRWQIPYKAEMNIRCPSVETIAKLLSGGNQQKIVIAKWLATRPKILILDGADARY